MLEDLFKDDDNRKVIRMKQKDISETESSDVARGQMDEERSEECLEWEGYDFINNNNLKKNNNTLWDKVRV